LAQAQQNIKEQQTFHSIPSRTCVRVTKIFPSKPMLVTFAET